jgi:hypothetical protein
MKLPKQMDILFEKPELKKLIPIKAQLQLIKSGGGEFSPGDCYCDAG